MIIRFREIDRDGFNLVKTGYKTIETRAATPRYRGIKVGDILTFTCGRDRFNKTVVAKQVYRNARALLKSVPLSQVAPDRTTKQQMLDRYASFPDYEQKITKYGLVAWKLQ